MMISLPERAGGDTVRRVDASRLLTRHYSDFPINLSRLGESDLRQRATAWSLDRIVRALGRIEASLVRMTGRPGLVACLTRVRKRRLEILLEDLELAFLDAAQHAAWLETALMGEAGHQELTGVLSEDEWQVLGSYRRERLAEGLFTIQEGRRILAKSKGLLAHLDVRLRDRDMRWGA
ncbi:MAG: hypothetical protein CMJ86_01895 [Planctomycetes bacterium]|nr:hypothetical protein [Planctomycetota bacterium]